MLTRHRVGAKLYRDLWNAVYDAVWYRYCDRCCTVSGGYGPCHGTCKAFRLFHTAEGALDDMYVKRTA